MKFKLLKNKKFSFKKNGKKHLERLNKGDYMPFWTVVGYLYQTIEGLI